jgi:hypothetical protein
MQNIQEPALDNQKNFAKYRLNDIKRELLHTNCVLKLPLHKRVLYVMLISLHSNYKFTNSLPLLQNFHKGCLMNTYVCFLPANLKLNWTSTFILINIYTIQFLSENWTTYGQPFSAFNQRDANNIWLDSIIKTY